MALHHLRRRQYLDRSTHEHLWLESVRLSLRQKALGIKYVQDTGAVCRDVESGKGM